VLRKAAQGARAMSEGDDPPPLHNLDTRLRAARERQGKGRNDTEGSALPAESGAGIGYRVSVELFAGMIFGGGIGWLLDRWLGTKPWLLVSLFILGAGAGLLNSYRAAMRADDVAPEIPPANEPGQEGRKKD
jgi:ATP synthase protein I